MPLSTDEELELLQLEEEEYQDQLHKQQIQPPSFSIPFVSPEIGKALQGGSQGFVEAAPAMAAGAAQGATMGFSDEIEAAGRAAILDPVKQAVSLQVPDMLSMPEKYREYKKMRQDANKKLAEESPIAYLGGEVLGTVATTPIIPSLGGAKLVSAAGKLSPKVAAFLARKSPQAIETAVKAGELTPEAAELALKSGLTSKILGAAGRDTIQSLPIGAVSGFGYSEADRPAELAMDTLVGAGMGGVAGAVTGGGAGIIGEGGKKLLEKLGDYDYGRVLKQGFKYGAKHLPIGESSVKDKLAGISEQRAKDLLTRFEDARKYVGEKIRGTIDQAQKNNTRININSEFLPEFNKYMGEFLDNKTLEGLIEPKTKKFIEILGNTTGDLTPVDAIALRDALGNSIQNLKISPNPVDKKSLNAAIKIQNILNKSIGKSVPDYAKYAKQFDELHNALPELIMSKGIDPDITGMYYGSLKNPELKFVETAEPMFRLGQMSGTDADKARRTLYKVRKNLNQLEESQPETVQKITRGLSAEDYGNKLRGQADELAMFHHAGGMTPNDPPDLWSKGYEAFSRLATGSKAPTLGAFHTAGKVAGSNVVKTGKNVLNISNDKLIKMSQYLKSKGGPLGTYGEKLEQALNNKQDTAKNAIIFAMLQNETYRNALKEAGFLSENEENK
jgi:hypothetical protein